jgi:hypothetical protein
MSMAPWKKARRWCLPAGMRATCSSRGRAVRAGIMRTLSPVRTGGAVSIQVSTSSSRSSRKASLPYDQEIFIATHHWEPYFISLQDIRKGPPPNHGLEVMYRSASFNDKALGHDHAFHFVFEKIPGAGEGLIAGH